MTSYTIRTTVNRPYAQTAEAVRAQLGEAGCGVLAEIDIKATLKEKRDIDVTAQVILGACRPELAHPALAVEPSIAAPLPGNAALAVVGTATEEVS